MKYVTIEDYNKSYIGKLVFNLGEITRPTNYHWLHFDFNDLIQEISVYGPSDFSFSIDKWESGEINLSEFYFYDHRFARVLTSGEFYAIYKVFPMFNEQLLNLFKSMNRENLLSSILDKNN